MPKPLAALLTAMVEDVHRASAEPLEIFPVCHHSPAAAVHMLRRLRTRPPRIIFMEMCEDLRPLWTSSRTAACRWRCRRSPGRGTASRSAWSPLSVVAPLTEFSAEYQAIAFALENPDTELVFVDRAVDHVFQWTAAEGRTSWSAIGPRTTRTTRRRPTPGRRPRRQLAWLGPRRADGRSGADARAVHRGSPARTPRSAPSPSGGISTSSRRCSPPTTTPTGRCCSCRQPPAAARPARRRTTRSTDSASATCGRA